MKDESGIVKAIGITNILLVVLIIISCVLISKTNNLFKELESTHTSLSHISEQINQDNNTFYHMYLDDILDNTRDISDKIDYLN